MEQFSFKGFTPNKILKTKTTIAINRIADRAPSDAKITAVLEQSGDMYHCSIEIGSGSFPFSVETSHKRAAIAVDKAELTALRKLDHWIGSRFLKMEEAPLRAPLRMAT